jgi:hypothetical protein
VASAGAKAKLDLLCCYGCDKKFATPLGVCKHLGYASNKSCRPKMDKDHRPFVQHAAKIHAFGQ